MYNENHDRARLFGGFLTRDTRDGNPTATSLNGQPGAWIYFVLKSGGKTIGPRTVSFTVQEKLTNFTIYGMPQPDSQWRPNNPTSPDPNDQGPSTSYYYGPVPGTSDYGICDFKTLTSFNGQFLNGPVCTYTQANQISWVDSAGNQVTVPLQTNDWTYTGVAGPQWIPTFK